MLFIKNRFQLIVGFGITLLLAGGIFFFAGQASADEAISADGFEAVLIGDDVAFPGNRGGNGDRDLTPLAEALGVEVDELEGALETVKEEAVEAAVEAGVISADEGEAVLEGESRLPRGTSEETGFDKEEALAEELDVTVEEIEAAQEEVRETRPERENDGEGRNRRGGRGNGRGGDRPAQPDNGDGDVDSYPAP